MNPNPNPNPNFYPAPAPEVRSLGVLAACIGLVLAMSGAACAVESDDEVGAPVDGPWQTIESGVDPDTVDTLLAASDLTDAREVADFHIYRPQPPGLDLQAPNCGLVQTGEVASECGGCYCMAELGIVCADYTCDPAALRFDAPPATASTGVSDTMHPPLVQCPNGSWPGDSWMDDCNVCTCLGDGTVSCTLMSCGEAYAAND